jgi:hypothetical protein
MRKRMLPALLALALGCSSGDNLPAGIIPREKMQLILFDMIQVDQFTEQYLERDTSKSRVRQEAQDLYAKVFRMHQISREEFQRSFDYYQTRPDLNRRIYDSLSAWAYRLRTQSFKKPTRPPLIVR